MKRDSKLSAALHALVHLATSRRGTMRSDEIAKCLDTNPVVVRRTIAGMREAGIVIATKGPGGGIRLGRAPGAISIADVSAALDEPLLKLGAEVETPTCLIEQSVVARLEVFRIEAERLLAERLSTMTLADIIADIGIQFSEHHGTRHHA